MPDAETQPAPTRRILLVTLGSGGDVHPYIGIGAALRVRGHDVHVLLNPHFAPRARAAGLTVHELGTERDYLEAIGDPRLVHARRGPRFVVEHLVAAHAPAMFNATRDLLRGGGFDACLRHLIAFGAGWAAQQDGVREIVGVLSPLFWFSTRDPGVFGPSGFRPPPWLARLRAPLARLAGRAVLDPPLNRARRALGLQPIPHAFARGVTGGDLNLGLWSPAFRPPQADDPPTSRVCGFVWFDGQTTPTLSSDLARFIDDGPPPIVFTLGTSVIHHAGDFYALAARACRRLGPGARAILLTGSKHPPAAALPAGVRALDYAPFSALLPRARLVVHHGGIGTTAQCLRAGVPAVIIPFANDEFDTASRAARLGAAVVIPRARLSERTLADALRRADAPATRAGAASVSRAMLGEDGARSAVDCMIGAGSRGRGLDRRPEHAAQEASRG